MKRKLREELVKLSTDIITSREDKELTELYEVAKTLYEKLAVLKFIDEKLSDVEVDVSKNVLAARFEKMASAVMSENRAVPESNPHEEDIITPGMDTIKGMVSEMPSEAIEYIFGDFMTKPMKAENNKDSAISRADGGKYCSTTKVIERSLGQGAANRVERQIGLCKALVQ